MGGKTSRSTQQITIPPEVLARYNAINARADAVTNRDYQYYQGQFVAPLTATQQAGIANTNAAANLAQSYYGNATNQLNAAQQGVSPYFQSANNQLNQGVTAGNQYANQSSASLNNALNAGNQYATQASGSLNNALNVGSQYAGQSTNTINAAYNQGAGIQQNALSGLGAAYASAQPYNQVAGGLYQQGLAQGTDITGRSLAGTQQALAGAQPYQGIATNYMTSGAQAVNPTELGADQINRYMSPYLSTVLQGTAGLLNQQNQQQQAGQMGNAIRSGAFGGDRGGIAAANLNQQQNLANAQIFSGLLNQGYGQALNTAQQQQQLGLSASQANRAAQQQAAQQALAIGQQGFTQGLSAAQQQAALGQQLFNMNATTGQNAAALGQQVYGQGTNTAQQQSAVGNTLFNQGATTAQQQAALGQQQFAQNATAAQQQAALGQQQFAQSATAAQQQAALGQQLFNQGNTAAGTSAALGTGLYNIGANTASQLAALGTGAQSAALSGAAAQMTAGQAQQATQQAENNALYNQFLQAQSLPYQQLQLASNIALGTGTASGSTTTTAQPGGFFSDERLKENIKAVGKTFDGQTIHSYNYKGDPRTQIGLIAQEVQKHHPEAVGLAGGYKTVDYDKATEDAADRGHMASGGLASAGGSVMPQDAGQGFSNGGLAGFDPAVMQQMLAAQQAMYAPLSDSNIYAGGPNAGGGLVPQSSFAPSQLMTPAALPQQSTGAEKAATIANLGKTVGELGGEVGAWDWGGEEAKKADKTPVPTAAASAPAATGVAPPKPVDTTVPDPEEFSSRKRPYAFGGGIPYGGQGLDIPTSGLEVGSGGPMTAGALPGQQSGLDKLGKIANVADTGMKLGKFGQKIGLFSTGGTPYGGQGLDIPEGDDLDASRQPMTAASLEKPESGLDKVGKIAKIAGTVAKVAAMFSDKRMKENIKPIGKLFDGQIVHSYNYKGDPRTQIGLIAQEVEGYKPHAVGKIKGMKAVDYAKATSAAAKRGHFAAGGMPEEEMEDVPSYEPTGLYSGDNKFIRNLFKSTASGNKNIDLMSGEEMPAQMGEEVPQNAGFAKMAEPVGLAGASETGIPEIIKAAKSKEMTKPAGLAPTVGPLPTGIMQIARLIHAGEGTGKNPRSSALGPYQFVDSTFAGEFRKNYPERARGMSDREIIALKRSPEGAAISEAMGPKFIANSAKIVERAGFVPDAGNVYLAHFLGPDTAVKVLRANPNAPISRYVSQEAIDANPPLQKNPTVGGTINWARGYMQKQADHLNRKQRASGGLAGRNGYATDGRVEDEFRLPEDINALAEAERRPTEEIVVAPEVQKPEGLAPQPVAPPVALAASSPANMARAVAEAAPAAEKPQGLGAAAPKDNNIFRGKFFTGLKEGKATSVIPFLSGLAAMGTAPTRSLGVALSAGIGAGAQAAQAQRAFGIKQGELQVAQQLADARTMEITKGILEGRYQFLENGQVLDKYTDTFLPTDLATIAKGKAFQSGPMEAIAGKMPGAVNRETYLKENPTAGTGAQNLPASTSYKANPSNPRETILAAGEFNPGVVDARADRDSAEARMKDLYKTLSSPGIGPERYTQLSNLYNLAKIDYDKANTLWKETLANVTASAIASLDAGNQALISVNAETLVPLITAGQQAIKTRNTLEQIRPIVTQGGPLSEMLSKIGSGLKQVGANSDLVDSILGAPDAVQQQNLLAGQLQLAGMDADQIQRLRSGASGQFERAAVEALLKNIQARADADIAAAQTANASFQSNPTKGNVPETGMNAQQDSFKRSNAPIYRTRPAPGALPKGTPYRVLGDPKTYYAK